MLKRVILFFSCLTIGVSATTLLHETFEPDDGLVAGPMAGQNGWAISSGTANVQSNVVHSGGQALEMAQATIMHAISSTNSTLWTRFQARIGGAPQNMPGEAHPNTSVAFFVGTNLNIVAYSNNIPVDLGAAMPTNVWTQFDVYCDYDLMVWNLSMDGTTIGVGLPLYSTGTTINSIQLSSESNTRTYIDQLNLVDHELASNAPDLDLDQIPDWWELKHFGGITAATAGHPSGNSDMNILETYIAGVNPFIFDPFAVAYAGNLNWISIPGRRYEIQWAPSLSSNFTTIATVDWPIDHYGNITNTLESSGFYRLNVSVP